MINRDELLKMARDAGFQTGEIHLHDGSSSYLVMKVAGNHCALEVARLVDIVLERAAKICEDYAHEALTENDAFTANLLGAKIRNLKGTNQ